MPLSLLENQLKEKNTIPIDVLRQYFGYDPITGKVSRLIRINYKSPVGPLHEYRDRNGYLIVTFRFKKFLVHRLAWALHFGEWPEGNLDHKNRCTDDNWIENLRECNQSQNGANTLARSISGRKGVFYKCGKWYAQVLPITGRIYLGNFETIDEAAHAYNKMAIEVFGEFAVLNPIGTDY